jgi:hypothetical protein
MTKRNPTLDDIQKAAQRFRVHNSVMALREILAKVCGEPLTVVSDVPDDKRADVIAALEGKAGASAFIQRDGQLDTAAIYARWNRTGS